MNPNMPWWMTLTYRDGALVHLNLKVTPILRVDPVEDEDGPFTLVTTSIGGVPQTPLAVREAPWDVITAYEEILVMGQFSEARLHARLHDEHTRAHGTNPQGVLVEAPFNGVDDEDDE